MHNTTSLSNLVRGAAILALAAMTSVPAGAIRPATGPNAPLPDYDARSGYFGPVDLENPVVAAEAALLRQQRSERPRPAPVAPRAPISRGELEALFGPDLLVNFGPQGNASQLVGGDGAPLFRAPTALSAEEAAREFLRRFGHVFGVSAEAVGALPASPTETAPGGLRKVRFGSEIDGIRVYGAELMVVLSKENEVLTAAGRLYPDLEVFGGRALSAVDAALAAGRYAGEIKPGVPVTVDAWSRTRHVTEWTAEGIRDATVDPGPRVLAGGSGTDERSLVSRGPFGTDIDTRLFVYPETALAGRLAWRVPLFKSALESYVVLVDAEDGRLLSRRNHVKFAGPQTRVFPDSPGAGPLTIVPLTGNPPATPAAVSFVTATDSGLHGNNVLMTQGANEFSGMPLHWNYGFMDTYATSAGALFNFNLDSFSRLMRFRPNAAGGYNLATKFPASLPPVGAQLFMPDDSSVCGPPPIGFDYFGFAVTLVCVNSNGDVTFEGADPFGVFSLPALLGPLNAPSGRVMGLHTDLNPSAGCAGCDVWVTFTGSTLTFRWVRVPEFGVSNENTVGITLRGTDDAIFLHYPWNRVAATAGGSGLVPPFGGSASWLGVGGMATRGQTGMARFFPDTGRDMQIAADTIFWTLNEIGHDRQWFNGFTEPNGNFQMSNLGRGGLGGDPILATPFGGSFFFNAFFGTPPDGVCCPFTGYGLFGPPFAFADSSLDTDIVVHEFGHGLTNRLVGGPADDTALNADQSGAMGEGWSDVFALIYNNDPVMGEYTTGDPVLGIRSVAYTPDNVRSYDQFGNLFGPFLASDGGSIYFPEVHFDGEIWASALASMRDRMLTAGATDADVERLVVAALFLTPALPTMQDARNAILLAESILFGSTYTCDVWQAFAVHGLGLNSAASVPVFITPAFTSATFGTFDSLPACGGAFARGFQVVPLASFQGPVGATSHNGWVGSGLWHISTARSSHGDRSMYYGQTGPGDYNTGAVTFGSLVSPVLNLAGVNNPVLEFDLYLDNEFFPPFDAVYVRHVGGSVLGDAQRMIQAYPNFAFQTFRVDLSPLANTTTEQIEFYFDSLDAFFNFFEGAYIDNVQIRSYTEIN